MHVNISNDVLATSIGISIINNDGFTCWEIYILFKVSESQLAIEPKGLSWLVVASIDFPEGFDLRAPGENQETKLRT
jgi:hypothetical protein